MRPSVTVSDVPAAAKNSSDPPWLKGLVNAAAPAAVKIGGLPVGQVSQNLFNAARSAARSALLKYTDDRVESQLRCALEAGAATEWLIRALLARSNPALLADRGHKESQLALAGVRPIASTSDHLELRTISTTDVAAHLALIHPALAFSHDVKSIMQVRNSAAHMAIVTKSSLHESVRRLVRVVSAVIPEFDVDATKFWSPRLVSVAEAITKDFDDETAARVASKIAAAKERIRELTRQLPPAGVEAALTALEARRVPHRIEDDTEDDEYDCPACERRAWVTFVKVRDDGDLVVDYDREGEPEGAWLVFQVTLVPVLLQCPVCELELDGADDELEGLPGISERPGDEVSMDAAEYYADWDDD